MACDDCKETAEGKFCGSCGEKKEATPETVVEKAVRKVLGEYDLPPKKKVEPPPPPLPDKPPTVLDELMGKGKKKADGKK